MKIKMNDIVQFFDTFILSEPIKSNENNSFYRLLFDKRVISTQFLCEKLDIDYDVETERVRLETEFRQQLGN